jgi:alanine racemase
MELWPSKETQAACRVCMNMTMIDVTDVPGARAGDVSTMLGQDGEERVSTEQLAGWMGSIHDEVVSRIHAKPPAVLAG